MPEFPEHQKLNLNPDCVPDNYWETALKCNNCDMRWPNLKPFAAQSICCRTNQIVVKSPPEYTWPEAIRLLKKYLFEIYYQTYNGNLNEEAQIWRGAPLEVSSEQLSIQELEEELDHLTQELDRP